MWHKQYFNDISSPYKKNKGHNNATSSRNITKLQDKQKKCDWNKKMTAENNNNKGGKKSANSSCHFGTTEGAKKLFYYKTSRRDFNMLSARIVSGVFSI